MYFCWGCKALHLSRTQPNCSWLGTSVNSVTAGVGATPAVQHVTGLMRFGLEAASKEEEKQDEVLG